MDFGLRVLVNFCILHGLNLTYFVRELKPNQTNSVWSDLDYSILTFWIKLFKNDNFNRFSKHMYLQGIPLTLNFVTHT